MRASQIRPGWRCTPDNHSLNLRKPESALGAIGFRAILEERGGELGVPLATMTQEESANRSVIHEVVHVQRRERGWRREAVLVAGVIFLAPDLITLYWWRNSLIR